MKGYLYVAGAVEALEPSDDVWLDPDPHFWTSPPTWGICRNDLRRVANVGDYIFFVTPLRKGLPRGIFAYLRIAEMISHRDAYARADLRSKRMRPKANPNGNIIVDSRGKYSSYDEGIHRDKFERIASRYAIGDPADSRWIGAPTVREREDEFIAWLRSNVGSESIPRFGIVLTADHVVSLLAWLGDVGEPVTPPVHAHAHSERSRCLTCADAG